MSMHADEESDEGVIPMKRPNKEGSPSAEAVEGRTSQAREFGGRVVGEHARESPWWPILWLKWRPDLSTCRKVRHAEMAESGARQTGGSPPSRRRP